MGNITQRITHNETLSLEELIELRDSLPEDMDLEQIEVHHSTNNPTEAWKELGTKQKVIKVNVKIPSKPVDSNKIRFVCMSDTHSLLRNDFEVPPGDVYIHAGDFTRCGQKDEVIQFSQWLGTLPHKHKIVIAGNHELSFDEKFSDLFRKKIAQHLGSDDGEQILNYGNTKDDIVDAVNEDNIRQYLTNCTYLEDSALELYGIKIYGSPWQPEFGGWAFNIPRGNVY